MFINFIGLNLSSIPSWSCPFVHASHAVISSSSVTFHPIDFHIATPHFVHNAYRCTCCVPWTPIAIARSNFTGLHEPTQLYYSINIYYSAFHGTKCMFWCVYHTSHFKNYAKVSLHNFWSENGQILSNFLLPICFCNKFAKFSYRQSFPPCSIYNYVCMCVHRCIQDVLVGPVDLENPLPFILKMTS